MFNPIGCGRGIGGALRHAIPGESFIRHIGNDKLIFDFKEGSGTTVRDKSHCGNNGTFGAGAAAPTWKRNSLYFDGGTEYVLLTGISHGISTGGFTFCFSLSNFTNSAYIFDQTTTLIYIRTSATTGRILLNVLTDSITLVSPLYLQFTRDEATNLECYVNGSASRKGLSDATDFSYNGTSVVTLGTRQNFLSGIIGTMYSFRILNKGLSGIECQQEYLANKFRGNN